MSTFGALVAIDDVTKVTVSSQNGTHSADFGTNDYVFDDIRAIAAADTAPPSVSSIAYTGPAAANASVITYRVVFDEAVRNLTAADFSLVAAGTANGTISGLAPVGGSGGTTYDVTVTAVVGTGTLRVDLNALTDVTDTTGNGDGTNGHVSAYTAGGTHAVDRDTPAQPAASVALDTGSSGADGITNVGIVNVGGLETNATWQYSVNGGATFVPGSGSTFTLASGSYAAGDVQVRQTDQAGNVGPSVSLSAVTVDATAPGAPTALALAAGSDSGASATDGVTAVRTPTVGGHAEAGAIVRLLDLDRGTTLGTTTADGNGDWSLATSSLGDGTYRLVATAQDSAGNTSTSAVPTSVTVDATGPSVASVAVPANGTYGAGQRLEFTVDFDEAVFVDTVTGAPRLGMVLNSGGAVSADYVSGSGSGSLLFRYTVAAGNADPDGIAIGSFAVNGGTIRDVAGNDAVLTLNNVGSTSGVLVDAGAPSVMALTAVTPSGTYAAGSAIDIRVTFSKAVNVAGVPRLALETGTTDRFAEYVGGAGTDTIVFRYDVQPGDAAADLDTVGTSAFDLNGGTIRDTSGNDAALALPAPGAPGSLGANAAVVVDAVAPVLSSATVNGSALVLSFGEALDTASALPGAFTVMANGMPVSVGAVSTSGSAATLTLASAVAPGAAVTVAYADPTPGDDANAVQDVAGNDFASQAATNVTNTTAPPPSTPSPTPPTPSPSGPTPFPDRLMGTAASETTDGLDGDDTIVGGSGNDTLLGGAGSDQIMATPILRQIAYVYGGTGPNNPDDGADLLTISGRGAASVWGNGGDDVVSYAADGAATIYAGVGADTVEVANDAANIMIGGSGAGDVLTVRGDGANTVFGGSSNVDPLDGADRILVVGNGANALFGNGGADRIEIRGSGNNLVHAGFGADEVVINGSGSNTVYGGTGAGDVVTIRGDGNNVVYGGSFNGDAADGADLIRIEGNGANVVYANGGDDLVVIAGSGRNTVFGGFGNDTIVGGSGGNRIVGGPGANVMSGGNGADRFVVNAGGVDFITDFNLLEGDRIETGGQAYTVSQTAEGYAGISFGNGSYIVLQGVAADAVTGDFFA
ncbi:repeat-containing protein [Aureimonas phyllosphaerae]|nr:repeat-containing protein [Aureimonas phyllosphaerae]